MFFWAVRLCTSAPPGCLSPRPFGLKLFYSLMAVGTKLHLRPSCSSLMGWFIGCSFYQSSARVLRVVVGKVFGEGSVSSHLSLVVFRRFVVQQERPPWPLCIEAVKDANCHRLLSWICELLFSLEQKSTSSWEVTQCPVHSSCWYATTVLRAASVLKSRLLIVDDDMTRDALPS